MSNLFGPVPSRRLGRSLGIDVIPPKTCSYDCIYCESGRTTHLTIKRQAFVNPDDVLLELEAYFREHPRGADTLTLSSAGEPTLYEPLGELLRAIKNRFSQLPLVVLTNGSLLWDARVRQDLLAADRVVPSLDAVSSEIFQRVDRPHLHLDLSLIVEGLQAFRRDYRGRLHIEVMLVAGRNDNAQELKRIATVIDRLNPDEVELNTVVRPPADPDACGLSAEEMDRALAFFPQGVTRVIGCFQGPAGFERETNLDDRIVDMVRRRPCTAVEISASFGVKIEDLNQALDRLQQQGRLGRYSFNDLDYLCGR